MEAVWRCATVWSSMPDWTVEAVWRCAAGQGAVPPQLHLRASSQPNDEALSAISDIAGGENTGVSAQPVYLSVQRCERLEQTDQFTGSFCNRVVPDGKLGVLVESRGSRIICVD